MAQPLCDLKCTPCREGADPLKGEALTPYAQQVPDWTVAREHHLSRTFTFKNFARALEFVNRVGQQAEEQGHHPNIQLTWGRVVVEIWTHKIDGLTASDFILAAKIDRTERP